MYFCGEADFLIKISSVILHQTIRPAIESSSSKILFVKLLWMIIMATTVRFKISQMNFEVQDFRDEFAKFMQHCNLIFTGPYAKKTEKEQFFFSFCCGLASMV